MGHWNEPMAPIPAHSFSFRLTVRMLDCVLGLLQRWPQTRAKACSLLFSLFSRLFCLLPHHVGCGSGSFPERKGLWKRQGSLGLVLPAKHESTVVPK